MRSGLIVLAPSRSLAGFLTLENMENFEATKATVIVYDLLKCLPLTRNY